MAIADLRIRSPADDLGGNGYRTSLFEAETLAHRISFVPIRFRLYRSHEVVNRMRFQRTHPRACSRRGERPWRFKLHGGPGRLQVASPYSYLPDLPCGVENATSRRSDGSDVGVLESSAATHQRGDHQAKAPKIAATTGPAAHAVLLFQFSSSTSDRISNCTFHVLHFRAS